MHVHFIPLVPKVSLAMKLFPTLVALAKTAYRKWSQNARAFYSYGSQGFICNEIISHIPIAYRNLSQDARAFYSYGSPGLHLEGNYFPHNTCIIAGATMNLIAQDSAKDSQNRRSSMPRKSARPSSTSCLGVTKLVVSGWKTT